LIRSSHTSGTLQDFALFNWKPIGLDLAPGPSTHRGSGCSATVRGAGEFITVHATHLPSHAMQLHNCVPSQCQQPVITSRPLDQAHNFIAEQQGSRPRLVAPQDLLGEEPSDRNLTQP